MSKSIKAGDWVSWDGSVYQVMALKTVNDPIVLQRLTTYDELGETYLILKRHSKYMGKWAKPSMEIARLRQCALLDAKAMRYVQICNKDVKLFHLFNAYSSDNCYYRLELMYAVDDEWILTHAVERINNEVASLQGQFDLSRIQSALAKETCIDLSKPNSPKKPIPKRGMRLVLYSPLMSTNDLGYLLFSEGLACKL